MPTTINDLIKTPRSRRRVSFGPVTETVIKPSDETNDSIIRSSKLDEALEIADVLALSRAKRAALTRKSIYGDVATLLERHGDAPMTPALQESVLMLLVDAIRGVENEGDLINQLEREFPEHAERISQRGLYYRKRQQPGLTMYPSRRKMTISEVGPFEGKTVPLSITLPEQSEEVPIAQPLKKRKTSCNTFDARYICDDKPIPFEAVFVEPVKVTAVERKLNIQERHRRDIDPDTLKAAERIRQLCKRESPVVEEKKPVEAPKKPIQVPKPQLPVFDAKMPKVDTKIDFGKLPDFPTTEGNNNIPVSIVEESKPATLFSFGKKKNSAEVDKSPNAALFSFDMKRVPGDSAKAPSAPLFSFGAKDASKDSAEATQTEKPLFSFEVKKPPTDVEEKVDVPLFDVKTEPTKPLFSFDAEKNLKPVEESKTLPNFGFIPPTSSTGISQPTGLSAFSQAQKTNLFDNNNMHTTPVLNMPSVTQFQPFNSNLMNVDKAPNVAAVQPFQAPVINTANLFASALTSSEPERPPSLVLQSAPVAQSFSFGISAPLINQVPQPGSSPIFFGGPVQPVNMDPNQLFASAAAQPSGMPAAPRPKKPTTSNLRR